MTSLTQKKVTIIGGPNGAGKTTVAMKLKEHYDIPYINADHIAEDLNSDNPDKVKIKAGRIFLRKIDELIAEKRSFILETTLSGIYLKRIIEKVIKEGYLCEIVYILIESPKLASKRIKQRVLDGGHFIPDQVINRRFYRSKDKFWNLYRKLSHKWFLSYNSGGNFHYLAFGEKDKLFISDELLFHKSFKNKKQLKSNAESLKKDTFIEAFALLKIGNTAVKEVQSRNRNAGIPNTYSKNGNIFYELPDGNITLSNPF